MTDTPDADDEQVQAQIEAMQAFPGGPQAYIEHLRATQHERLNTDQGPAPVITSPVLDRNTDESPPGLLIDHADRWLFVPDTALPELARQIAAHLETLEQENP